VDLAAHTGLRLGDRVRLSAEVTSPQEKLNSIVDCSYLFSVFNPELFSEQEIKNRPLTACEHHGRVRPFSHSGFQLVQAGLNLALHMPEIV
jgi:hypothetical protein